MDRHANRMAYPRNPASHWTVTDLDAYVSRGWDTDLVAHAERVTRPAVRRALERRGLSTARRILDARWEAVYRDPVRLAAREDDVPGVRRRGETRKRRLDPLLSETPACADKAHYDKCPCQHGCATNAYVASPPGQSVRA
jgi:hypothetical protein